MSEQASGVGRARMIVNLFGLLLLAATFGWSVVHVSWQSFGITKGPLGEGKKVITFVHWQLEGRTVEGMQWAADEYMRLHPDVHVQQIAVPTNAYDQWVRTQLIGRTAPDLIEMWGREDWDNLAVRYFVPMPAEVDQPNPYNAGTDLEGVPWRQTYLDGMRGGLRQTLQEFYCAPLSIFTMRIYANRDLLDKVAAHVGRPIESPQTLSELMSMCEDVNTYSEQTGDKVVPIAGSSGLAGVFTWKYLVVATAPVLGILDEDLDGDIMPGVALEAAMTGRFDMTSDPHLRVGHMVLYDICRYFNKGFMSSSRDMPISLFSQGKAAMIATGSWEAGSLYRQIGDDFRITVFDFPVAKAGHPRYGDLLQDRATEAGLQSGFPMGLTRFSKHRDIALDFLHFLTSREINEQINRRFRWFPAIRGAGTDEILAAFEPDVEGVYQGYTNSHVRPGSDTDLSYQQKFNGYIGRDEPTRPEYQRFLAACVTDRDAFAAQYGALADRFLVAHGADPAACTYGQYLAVWRREHYQQFIDSYAADYKRLAMRDFHRVWEDRYRAISRSETGLANARAQAVQRGLTDRLDEDIRRNLSAVTYGQVSRTMQRGDSRMHVERIKRQLGEGGRQ